jgi:hypothetical protein
MVYAGLGQPFVFGIPQYLVKIRHRKGDAPPLRLSPMLPDDYSTLNQGKTPTSSAVSFS